MREVKQPVIARLETGATDPRLNTVMKILYSLGKTLEIKAYDNVQTRPKRL